ncbi:hypothetical protein FCM35_KLT01560 [Carex littledalei]|uniref:Uncharacterized protein n=1 Tax=Carex littledalei TaxID=544730 RepID=A0A833VUA9_9POAL|nr:hypothetical protein FCM35_KLT01560 [Carex littledalei]
MEHFLKQCDKELMKMAMIKHEETFRQQVHELHRLYRIQKQLMRDVKSTNELKRQRSSMSPPNHHSKPRRALNLQLPADEYIVSTQDEHETELELTLAIGCTRKKREGTPLASDSGGSFSSSSTESGGPVNHEWVPLPVTDHVMVRSFDEIKNPPWFVQCLSLRMT